MEYRCKADDYWLTDSSLEENRYDTISMAVTPEILKY